MGCRHPVWRSCISCRVGFSCARCFWKKFITPGSVDLVLQSIRANRSHALINLEIAMNPVCRLSRAATLAVFITAVIAASTAFNIPFNTEIACTDETKEAGSKTEEIDPDYAVPDGSPKEIMGFLDELKARKSKFANRREEIDHLIKLYRAFIDGGEKILNQDTTEKVAANAARMKLNSLLVLASNEIGDSGQRRVGSRDGGLKQTSESRWPKSLNSIGIRSES